MMKLKDEHPESFESIVDESLYKSYEVTVDCHYEMHMVSEGERNKSMESKITTKRPSSFNAGKGRLS